MQKKALQISYKNRIALLKAVVTGRFRPDQPTQNGGTVFVPVGYNLFSKEISNDRLIDFYISIPEVNTILNRRATAKSRMVLEAVSKETGKPYNSYPNLVRVFRQPNHFQSLPEFIKQSSLFLDIFGDEYGYFNALPGYRRSTKSWYTIPPNLVTITAISDTPFFLSDDAPDISYMVKWGNKDHPLYAEHVLHSNDCRVKMTPQRWVNGESKLRSLAIPCQNIEAAYQARNSLIKKRLMLGIVSPESDAQGNIHLFDGDKKDLKEQVESRYGYGGDQSFIAFASKAVKWTQTNIAQRDLMLFEETEADTIEICNVFGYPWRLLASSKSGNMAGSDIRDLQKVWYQDSILPETFEKVESLNKFFQTENQTWHIIARYDGLEFLQEDKKGKAETLTIAVNALSRALADNAITLDEYMAELKYYGHGNE